MLAGLLIGFAGVVVIFYNYLGQLQNKSFLFGITLATIGTISWALGTVYSSKQKPPINILFNVGLQMLIAGVIMLTVCGYRQICKPYIPQALIHYWRCFILLCLVL